MRGVIGDRPWGTTLATIGLGGHSGQLTLTGADERAYRIGFANGVVIGATSPVAADSLARIALGLHLISAAQARALARVDGIERFAAAAKLGPSQIQELKRRVVVQRAARTFAIDEGSYVVDDQLAIPAMLGIEVDIRAVIYEGSRLHLSQARMTQAIHGLGSRFVLRPADSATLAGFGFAEVEAPVLAALASGTSVPELESTRRDLDPRMAEAVILALAQCDAVQAIATTRVPTRREPTITRVPTRREPTISRVPTPRAATSSVAGYGEVEATRMRPSALAVAEVRQLIAIGVELLERGVDHFTFLGLPWGAPLEDVHEAYLEFARYLRPDKLAALGIDDDDHEADAVFAQVVIAYSVLTEPGRRAQYLASQPPPS